jgi:ethylbenzene dehydrogenase
MKGSQEGGLGSVARVGWLPLVLMLVSATTSARGASGAAADARVTAVPTAKQTANLEAAKVGDETQALTWLAAGDYYEKALSSQYPNGSKGQVYKGEYNMTGSIKGIDVTVRMSAAYTNTDLYLQIQWKEPTGQNDLNRRRFLFNGPDEGGTGVVPGWSSQLNDDKFAIAFDINGAADNTGTFQEKGCTVGCHGEMNPTQGLMDVWHWKTSRSNIVGYVNDQFSDPAGRHTDAGDPIEVRNWKVKDNIAAGPGLVWDPTLGKQFFALPDPNEGSVELDPTIFLLKGHTMPLKGDATAGDFTVTNICQSCHDFGGSERKLISDWGLNKTDAEIVNWLKSTDHPGSGEITTLKPADFDDVIARVRGFTGVPGYYLQSPTGSAADLVVLNSKTVFKDGIYTVQIRRPLNTGYADDVQFDPVAKKEYVFGVAVMDKDGKNHAGSPRQILQFLD